MRLRDHEILLLGSGKQHAGTSTRSQFLAFVDPLTFLDLIRQ